MFDSVFLISLSLIEGAYHDFASVGLLSENILFVCLRQRRMGILHRNAVFRLHIHGIQREQKQPFQRLHHEIDDISRIGRADALGDGIAEAVIEAADGVVEARRAISIIEPKKED